MIVRILDAWVTLKFVLRRAIRGCDGKYDAEKKQILVYNGLEDPYRLEIILHELLHAADYYKDEVWVKRTAHDIAEILTKLGYKRDPASGLHRIDSSGD